MNQLIKCERLIKTNVMTKENGVSGRIKKHMCKYVCVNILHDVNVSGNTFRFFTIHNYELN